MNLFSSLLKYSEGKNPAAAQKKARSGFAKAVSRSRLSLRTPSVPIPRSGRHFILGVALYSMEELKLLDELDQSLRSAEAPPPEIQVFDVLECQQISDFGKFVPGIDDVYRTPVIGVLIDGKLVDQATGVSDVVDVLRRFSVLDHRLPV
jgi:hypothetical protein